MSETRQKSEFIFGNSVVGHAQRADTLGTVYETVLKIGSANAKQVHAAINELPIECVDAAITELRNLGVLRESRLQPEAFRAVSPSFAFSSAVEGLLSHLTRDLRGVEAVARVIEGLDGKQCSCGNDSASRKPSRTGERSGFIGVSRERSS